MSYEEVILIRRKKMSWVVVIDLIMVFILGYFLADTKLPSFTTFQKIVVGLGCDFVFLILNLIRIVGEILQIFCSFLWTYILMTELPFGKWTNNSRPWMIGIAVVIFLIILGIHSNFFKDYRRERTPQKGTSNALLQEKKEIKKMKKEVEEHLNCTKREFQEAVAAYEKAKKVTCATGTSIQEVDYVIVYTWGLFSDVEGSLKRDASDLEMLYEINEYLENVKIFIENLHQNTKYLYEAYHNAAAGKEKSDEEAKTGFEEMFFAGCNDKESVRLRYKQLMQSFHPDQRNGDEEMAKRIQNAYESKISKM